MTAQTTTETASTDNGTPPETGEGADSTDNGTPPETGEGADKTDESTEEGRLKFLRSKLDEATKKLKAFETADEERKRAEMSEGEKLKADLDAANAQIAELRRKTIAAEHGLDAELADRLKGETPEELEADAKRLAEKFGQASKPQTPPAKDVGLGVPAGDSVQSDPVKAHRAALAGYRF